MANAVQTTGQKAQNLYFLQRIVAESNRRLHKNAVGLCNETINPLWNINERQAQLIYDFARTGNYAQIQYLYNEIEERDPTLLVCVTRRTSAVAELDWRVVRSDERLNRNADKALIDEQIECVETAMAKIDNMPDVLEHLALSAFRGFSVVAPIHDVSGDIKHLDLVDSWNLCFDRLGQSWYFNPTASSFAMPTTVIGRNAFKGLQYIPHDQICAVTRKREIDWPAMQIFLRAAVGERDWGRFLETYGLPPVIITMPEFTNKEEQEAYIQAAADVFEGRSGVVPYGSNVNYASESRGTNPFTEFIEHQQKLVVMMATGGTLATLAESGTGTLAGDAQQDEWKRIIRADKRIISNAINKQICENIIRNCKDFKDKPILAEFQLDDTPKPTPKEMLELAGAAATAGFEMDVDELSQACGFTLRKKVEGGDGGFGGLPPFGGGGNGGGDTDTVVIPDQPDNQGDQPKPEEDPNGGTVDKNDNADAVTNVDEGAGLSFDAITKHLETIGFKVDAKFGRNGQSYKKAGDYKLTSDGDFGKMLIIYEKNGYFDVSVLDVSSNDRKDTKRVRTLNELDSYLNVYRNYNATIPNAAAEPPRTSSAGVSTPDPIKDTSEAPKASTPVSDGAMKAGEDLVRSLQADFKPVADRIAEILALPDAEKAGAAMKLLQEIDSLIPDDPAMAEVIADEMKAAFASQIAKQPTGAAPAANKVVPNAQTEIPDTSDNLFNTECHITDHLCRIHDVGKIEELSKRTPDECSADGNTALQKILADPEHKPAIDSMWRKTTGVIDLEWGEMGTPEKNYQDGWGVSKIAKKHANFLMRVPEVIAHGTIYEDKGHNGRYAVVKGDEVVVLYKDDNGCFVFTGFEPNARRYVRNLKANNPPLEAGR